MRYIKSFILALALLSYGVVAHAVEPTYATWDNKSKFAQSSGIKEANVVVLKWVRNAEAGDNASGIASGDVVIYDTLSDDGVSVRLTTTSADGAIAGIAVTTIATSDSVTVNSWRDDFGHNNWGWILVHGKVVAKTGEGGANNAQVGDPFITSTDSGAITTFANRTANILTSTAGGLQLTKTGGWFFDNDAQGTTAEVFVNLE